MSVYKRMCRATENYMWIEVSVSGIPCLAGVTDISSDEFSWEIFDRKGYKAEWLEKKMTDSEWDEINDKLIQALSD